MAAPSPSWPRCPPRDALPQWPPPPPSPRFSLVTRARSTPANGTEFWLRALFPAAEARRPAHRVPFAVHATATSRGGGWHPVPPRIRSTTPRAPPWFAPGLGQVPLAALTAAAFPWWLVSPQPRFPAFDCCCPVAYSTAMPFARPHPSVLGRPPVHCLTRPCSHAGPRRCRRACEPLTRR